MSKIPSPHFQMEHWAIIVSSKFWNFCGGNQKGGNMIFESNLGGNPGGNYGYCFFSFIFDKFWNSIYLTYIPKFGWEDLVYILFSLLFFSFFFFFFSSQRKLHSVPDIDFFLLNYNLFCPNRIIKYRITKIYPKSFNGKLWPYHLSSFINFFCMTQPIRLGFLKSLSLS